MLKQRSNEDPPVCVSYTTEDGDVDAFVIRWGEFVEEFGIVANETHLQELAEDSGWTQFTTTILHPGRRDSQPVEGNAPAFVSTVAREMRNGGFVERLQRLVPQADLEINSVTPDTIFFTTFGGYPGEKTREHESVAWTLKMDENGYQLWESLGEKTRPRLLTLIYGAVADAILESLPTDHELIAEDQHPVALTDAQANCLQEFIDGNYDPDEIAEAQEVIAELVFKHLIDEDLAVTPLGHAAFLAWNDDDPPYAGEDFPS